MQHTKFLDEAKATIDSRAEQYGSPQQNLERIAAIATQMLAKPISAYDIAMIQVATKLGRMVASRSYEDNYLDAINYLVFAKELSKDQQ
jgi:hypothetical protein